MLIRKLKNRIDNYLISIVQRAINKTLMERKPFDVERLSYLMASIDSAKFFQEAMPMARNLISDLDLLDYATSEVSMDRSSALKAILQKPTALINT